MKTPKHVPILRANTGEREALVNLDNRSKARILPLFEVGLITEGVRQRQYMLQSQTPTITYLDRALANLVSAWEGRLVMVDGYQWPADARTETGFHVIAHMTRFLRSHGVPTIPVVGYDRWENLDYQAGLRSVSGHEGRSFCLRIDSIGIEDSHDPDHFNEVIDDIVATLGLMPNDCCVLIDFGDVSVNSVSVDDMVAQSQAIIEMLDRFGFQFYAVAGCSLPGTINQAVHETDDEGTILRKESLAWKILRELIGSQVVSGDYGVRGPTTTEIRSKYTNGKIRYTIEGEIFVVRGHAFVNDGDCSPSAPMAQI